MIAEFSKFAGFKVLNYFLMHPSTEVHVQGLAKKLGINGATSAHYCRQLAKDGILTQRRQANLLLYSLRNDCFAVKELKKAFALTFLKEAGIEEIASEQALSSAIYGSFADGTFNEESDLDLIIIGEESSVERDLAVKFEKKAGRSVQLTIIPYFKWEKRKKSNDAFAAEIMEKHILVKGAEL